MGVLRPLHCQSQPKMLFVAAPFTAPLHKTTLLLGATCCIFFLFIPKLVTLDNQTGDSGLPLGEEQ